MPRKRRAHVQAPRHTVTQPSDPSYRFIPLTQGQNAIVDTADFEWLSQWNWHARWDKAGKKFYARRSNDHQLIHRVITNPSNGEECDHINSNGLDNRRSNLRKCTHLENSFNQSRRRHNKSGFKGVCWCKRNEMWLSQLHINGRTKHLGYFSSKILAALAHDEGAKKYFGEFANVNFH